MATLIPDTLPDLVSERALVEALRDQLDDDFTVFVNLEYLRGADLANGEVDLLIAHRTLGLCFIEAKGFGVTCDAQGRWWRQHRGRRPEPLKRSPMQQVKAHARAIIDAALPTMASSATHAGADWDGVPWCWMLAFPLTRVGEAVHLPLDLPREVVIDAGDLAEAGARVRAMMGLAASRQRCRPLPEPAWQRAVRDALHPRLDLVPDLGGQLDAARQAMVRLDARQRTIVECVDDNDRFRVYGPAGTGKSLLALETARRWAARRGRHVLLLCFNRMLRARLEQAVERLDPSPGRITVKHFHGLVFEALAALGRADTLPPRDASGDAKRTFWEQAAPPALAEAFDEGLLDRYDALVVDEAQDLHAEWWFYLAHALPDPDDDPLVAFYDPAQAVFGRPHGVPDELFTLRLHENYRNPRAVVDTLDELVDTSLRAHPDAHEGEPVRTYERLSKTKLARKLAELVAKYRADGLRLDELAVLGPHRKRNSSLADVDALGTVPLTTDLAERCEKLLYATVPGFKGLEAAVVFFIDVDASDDRCGAGIRYVGASRATHALHIFTRGAGWGCASS